MKHLLKFFLEVSMLKSIQRTGWVKRGVKNPETVADHVFLVVIMGWVLGREARLHVGHTMSMALLHELCEVYAGDMTPYFGMLSSKSGNTRKLFDRWIRLPQQEKERMNKKKFILEKKALQKLINILPKEIQHKIFALWMNYEHGVSAEGKFVKQVDKLEAFLQAIQYFGPGLNTPIFGWWEEIEETVSHPVLRNIVTSIEDILYHHKKDARNATLDFFNATGKLKTIPRIGWVRRNIKHPTSLAEHAFMRTLMAWVFFEHTRPALNIEKIMKLSLCVSLSSVALKEKTPSIYDPLLTRARTKEEREEILRTWVRYSLKMKQRMFAKSYYKEKCAVENLVEHLEPALKQEILSLWEELKHNHTGEAHFVSQVHALETLLQALQFYRQDSSFPIEVWWEWAFEHCDTQFTFDFMDELKKEFYKKKK